MEIYFLNIFLILLYGIIFLSIPSLKNAKIFCILASLNWIIISGLRHISIGADTYVYKKYFFDETIHQSWNSVVNNFFRVFIYNEPGKDPGYQFVEKFFQTFSDNYQLYLVFIALVFTGSLGIWIYKNSSDAFISFLIYSCLFYSFFAITGHRQTIATALVVLIGYKFVKERKIWPFLLLILIASTIHKSAFVFLIFYFIANKRITSNYLVFVAIIISISFAFKNQLMFFLGTVFEYESYINQNENAGAWTFTFAIILLTLVAIWKRKIMIDKNLQVIHFINALLIAVILLPLTFVNPSAMRIVQYFSIFIILLVPEIVRAFTKKEKVLVYYSFVSIILVLFVRNTPHYLFFWEG